jgi:hypothetical protein
MRYREMEDTNEQKINMQPFLGIFTFFFLTNTFYI